MNQYMRQPIGTSAVDRILDLRDKLSACIVESVARDDDDVMFAFARLEAHLNREIVTIWQAEKEPTNDK